MSLGNQDDCMETPLIRWGAIRTGLERPKSPEYNCSLTVIYFYARSLALKGGHVGKCSEFNVGMSIKIYQGVACSRLKDCRKNGSREVARGLGDGEVGPVSIVFNTSFRYTSFWYTPWLINFDSLSKHLRQSLGFARAESNKHGERTKPSYTQILTIAILTRQTVFLEAGGLRYLKRCLQVLPFSLVPPFFVRSPVWYRLFRAWWKLPALLVHLKRSKNTENKKDMYGFWVTRINECWSSNL